jgi:CHAD domain-containing protein
MKRIQKHLHEPVEVGCRQMASALLGDAAANCTRLEDAGDREALHDFRVAIRRLVSFLEAYRPYLHGQGYGDLRKRLTALIKATNAGRDTEVHVLWLRGQLKNRGVPKLQRQGLEIMLNEVNTGDSEVDVDARRALVPKFEKTRQRLEQRLSRPIESVRVNAAGEVITFGVATGAILRDRVAQLRKRVDRVDSLDRPNRFHKARLAGKRLRYVLDPVRDLVPGGKEAGKRLRRFQDLTGGLRDLQTLEEVMAAYVKDAVGSWSRAVVEAAMHEPQMSAVTRPTPEEEAARAVAAAIQRVRTEQRRLFASFHGKWLAGNGAPFFERMGRITRFLDPTFGEPQAAPQVPAQGEQAASEGGVAEGGSETPSADQENATGAEEDRTPPAPPPPPVRNVNWVFARPPESPNPASRRFRSTTRAPRQPNG